MKALWRFLPVLFLILFAFPTTHGNDNYFEEEDDMNYFLGQLYQEPDEVTYDPHDMLNYPGQKTYQPKKEPTVSAFTTTIPKMEDQESCRNYNKINLEEEMAQLVECEERLRILERDDEVNKQKIKNLEKKFILESDIDMKAFYRRFIFHIWNILSLQEAQAILKDDNEAIIRRLIVRITKDDMDALQRYLKEQNNVQQIDEFLQDALELDNTIDDTHEFSIRALWERVSSFIEVGKNVENWLYVLCIGFLLLSVWAVYLFIKDIQQQLRWMRVIWMMMILVFFICCLWHWRHMHKVALSQRYAKMAKKGFTSDIPEECKPEAKRTILSGWAWIKSKVVGHRDVCEEYFEDFMTDPSDEISPAMVISETLAKFVFQPMQHLGTESAKFLTNFYTNVPLVYQVQATVFFTILLIIILFVVFGYGIDFPLWMGGIRPIYRTETTDTSSIDQATKEAIDQLRIGREKFMDESRKMLSDIAKAATSSQVQQAGVQPLIMMSSGILESQLKDLIARQLSDIVPPTPAIDSQAQTPPFVGHNCSLDNPGIFTVTSTPIRGDVDFKKYSSNDVDVMDGQEALADERKDTDIGEFGVTVATDAVHRRFKAPQKKELKPMDIEVSPSTSSSSSNISKKGQRPKLNLETSFVNSFSSKNESPSVSNESEKDDKSKLSVSQVAKGRNMDSFSSDDSSGSGENFFNRVKSILEDSASSSLNVSQAGRSGTIDEIELSASGARFLSKVEKVMTP